VVRYHAHRLNRPSRVELSLSLFKHHIPHELSDVGLLDERGGRAKHSLPPLDSVIDENMTIIGDPQPFLDFAIIGFGKCGTSTLMYEPSESRLRRQRLVVVHERFYRTGNS
jgi:hypothetical protein